MNYDIQIYDHTTVCLSINFLKDILVTYILARKKWIKLCSKHLYASFYVDISFQLIWIDTREHFGGLYGKSIFSFVNSC